MLQDRQIDRSPENQIQSDHRAQDLEGRDLTLHYVRQEQGVEVDFALCDGDEPVTLAECKLSEAAVPNADWLARLAA